MSKCGCTCACHAEEGSSAWPGPCAACCEPGMNCDCGRATAHLVDPPAWAALMEEARSFEAWYAPTRMGVNAWVGVDTSSGGLYGGWSVDGDPLYDWDESMMMTAEGFTTSDVIADLIRIARQYREQIDKQHEEDELDADPGSST